MTYSQIDTEITHKTQDRFKKEYKSFFFLFSSCKLKLYLSVKK